MKKTAGLLIFLAILMPVTVQASVASDDFFNSTQNQPAWFKVNPDGSAFGATITGEAFTQKYVYNNLGLRLQKFVIGNAFFYISDKGIIRAENDLSAISIYFTLV